MDDSETFWSQWLVVSLTLFTLGGLLLFGLMAHPMAPQENATPTPEEACGCTTTVIFHTSPVNSTNYSGMLNMTYSNVTFSSSGDNNYSYANESQYVRQNITLTNNITINWSNATYVEWTGSIPECGCG